ncbi:MAG: alpha/beta fold hydrolase [Alphaproteobacteria bacterium]|nr:alpha/beta fold hydrolase [Alphaproteobacteria bacterium]
MPELILNGPAGRLEVKYNHSKIPNAPLAIVLHPHPEHGGTMNNKITFATYQAFVQRGFSTCRFNFRGVGKSQGVFDRGEGELSDAATVLDWMQSINPNAPYTWVGGYSFGAWIGMQLLMRRPEIRGFVSISPPANIFDFNFLAPCPQSGLIIHGAKDNLVPREPVDSLVQKLNTQKGINIDYRVMDDANHFYHDKLDTLTEFMHDHMDQKNAGFRLMNAGDQIVSMPVEPPKGKKPRAARGTATAAPAAEQKNTKTAAKTGTKKKVA